MLKKLNPNFAIILSTVLWGTWWLPLRLMNEYADNNAIPLFLSFMIAGLFLLVFSLQNIHLFTKKNIILTVVAAAFGAAAMCFYNEGLLRGNVARILIFFYLTAVWSTIIEIVFLRTPITLFNASGSYPSFAIYSAPILSASNSASLPNPLKIAALAN